MPSLLCMWSKVEAEQPKVAEFLKEYTRPVKVSGAPPDFRLFRFR